MKIEVWSDYACPYCYIGKRNLDRALEQFPHRSFVSVQFKSYELAPDADVNPTKTYHELLAHKFNKSLADAEAMTKEIVTQAAEVGLDYQFENMISTNTFDAHRLTKLAFKEGKGLEMVERIFKAHFIDEAHIGDHQLLTDLASEVGLDKEKVESFLSSCKCTKVVREDEEIAEDIQVQRVPFFLLNDKYALSGAQTTEVFLQALHQVWDEMDEKPTKLNSEEGSYCCGDERSCPN